MLLYYWSCLSVSPITTAITEITTRRATAAFSLILQSHRISHHDRLWLSYSIGILKSQIGGIRRERVFPTSHRISRLYRWNPDIAIDGFRFSWHVKIQLHDPNWAMPDRSSHSLHSGNINFSLQANSFCCCCSGFVLVNVVAILFLFFIFINLLYNQNLV